MKSTTDRARVVELYDMLRERAPSPVVDVNRALAMAMKSGARAGLDELDAIPEREVLGQYPYGLVLHLKNEDFSRDPKAVLAMNDDPLIANETQPTQTLAEMVRADERLKKEFPRITLPVLILHGTADKATKPSGSQFFYDTAGSGDKTLKFYDGAFHDLLNDVDKQVVMSDIQGWINARLPAA
jgi:alpha-beta hydrolase superfamily lysophospholipase